MYSIKTYLPTRYNRRDETFVTKRDWNAVEDYLRGVERGRKVVVFRHEDPRCWRGYRCRRVRKVKEFVA